MGTQIVDPQTKKTKSTQTMDPQAMDPHTMESHCPTCESRIEQVSWPEVALCALLLIFAILSIRLMWNLIL